MYHTTPYPSPKGIQPCGTLTTPKSSRKRTKLQALAHNTKHARIEKPKNNNIEIVNGNWLMINMMMMMTMMMDDDDDDDDFAQPTAEALHPKPQTLGV